MRDAPAASHATKKAHERSHHRYAETTGHSLRVGFNGYFVLSPVTGPVTGSFATVASRKNSAKLDTSVGVPGPHDFAVRNKPSLVQRGHCVHRIPRSTFVTTRTPLL